MGPRKPDRRQAARAAAPGVRRVVHWLAVLMLLATPMGSRATAGEPYRPVRPDPVREPWRWHSYPSLEGLGLRCLCVDPNGTVWFGLDDGVARYDGLHWTYFGIGDGLLSTPVNALCATDDGTIYAGSERGICSYSDGAWRVVFSDTDGFPWCVNDLHTPGDGSLWAGTAWGALALAGSRTRLYTSGDMAVALRKLGCRTAFEVLPDEVVPFKPWTMAQIHGVGVRVAEGAITTLHRGTAPRVVWALGSGSPADSAGLEIGDAIEAINGSQPILFNDVLRGRAGTSVQLQVRKRLSGRLLNVALPRRAIPGGCREFSVVDVAGGLGGRLWFGLESGEIVSYDAGRKEGRTGGWRLYDSKDGIDQGRVPQVLQTGPDQVWAVSLHGLKGINHFDGRGWSSTRLGDLGGSNMNTSILQTRDGDIWVGGNNALYGRIGGAWKVYLSEDLDLPAHLTRLDEGPDGTLWVAGLGQEAVRVDFGSTRWTSFQGLNYQCADSTGSLWFCSDDGSAVRKSGDTWMRFGEADGLVADVSAIVIGVDGAVWAAGEREGRPTLCRLSGSHWTADSYRGNAYGVNRDGAYVAGDGTLFVCTEDGVLLKYDPEAGGGPAWTRYGPPDVPTFVYGVAETADRCTWVGGTSVHLLSGEPLTAVQKPVRLSSTEASALCTDRQGRLWVGTRTYGLYCYDGERWTRFSIRDGLADNDIKNLSCAADGSIIAATPNGISRYDGATWVTHAFPVSLKVPDGGGVRQSPDGAFWINHYVGARARRSLETAGPYEPIRYSLQTVRCAPDTRPPETTLTLALEEVAYPGNVPITWKATDAWDDTPEAEILYACRLNGGTWSPYEPATSRIYQKLSAGSYTFEVKARDREFNEDPTPAAVHFTVLPPVWRQPWFLALIAVLAAAIGVQTVRVVRRGRKLRETNAALSESNRSLFQVNRDLQDRSAELQQVNARLEELDQLKTDFLSMVSHDLRTPMTAIKGYIDNMLDGVAGELNARQSRYLERMRLSTGRLTRMISDLLDLSRIERGAIESLDLRPGRVDMLDAVAEAVEGLRPIAEHSQLALRLDGDPADVLADRDRVQQVVTNLVGNAVKFTEPGGEIHVTVRREGNRHVRTSVRDTGIGIPPADLEKIFDLFYRVRSQVTREPGSGLGLAIAQRLVVLMGGEITAESQVGVGSTFTFTLPSASPQP